MANSMPGRPTVLRRRDGVISPVAQAGDQHFQTMATSGLLVRDRLPICLSLMRAARVSGTALSMIELRPDQHTVYDDIERYVVRAVDTLESGSLNPLPWGRYIQPPGTGKSVLIAETIARLGAQALVLCPRQNLVDQMAKELRTKLKDVPVGIYSGAEKDVVPRGVNVATYDILVARMKSGMIPRAIADATLVVCDEAHLAMTELRQLMLTSAFDEYALRIACTATPDYDERRALATHFPELIHEITLEEANRMELFAPMKVEILTAKVDGSTVRFVGQSARNRDLDPEEMGVLMSGAEIFEAARRILWETPETAGKSGVIFCSSIKKQAEPLLDYLLRHRPAGVPAPVLVTAQTPSGERRRILAAYAEGKILTLINVDVLTLGWDSPRCKVMIDLAPGLSEVRAKQKYFRVMRKFEGMVAHIYVILPSKLPAIPIFPQTLFGRSIDGTVEMEDWIARQDKRKKPEPKPKVTAKKKLRNAQVEIRTLRTFDSRNMRLDPRDRFQVGRVIGAVYDIFNGRLPTRKDFRRTYFAHALFEGYGQELMRYCGYRKTISGYREFSAWAMPDLVVNRYFGGDKDALGWCEDDAMRVVNRINAGQCQEGIAMGHRALFGADDDHEENFDIDKHRMLAHLKELLDDPSTFSERHAYVLKRRYGLLPESYGDAQDLNQVGELLGLSRERIRQIEREGLLRLHDRVREFEDGYEPLPDRMRAALVAYSERTSADSGSSISANPTTTEVINLIGSDGEYISYGYFHSPSGRQGVLLLHVNERRGVYIVDFARSTLRLAEMPLIEHHAGNHGRLHDDVRMVGYDIEGNPFDVYFTVGERRGGY